MSKTHIGRIFLKTVTKIKTHFAPLHLGFEIFNGHDISELFTPEFFRLLFQNGFVDPKSGLMVIIGNLRLIFCAQNNLSAWKAGR